MQEIEIDPCIKTSQDASAVIIFPDNSVTRMDEDTVVCLNTIHVDDDVTNINLQDGSIWNRVIEFINQDDSSFSVEASDTVASVRGTVFAITKNSDDVKYIFYRA